MGYPQRPLSYYGTVVKQIGTGSHGQVYLTDQGYAIKRVPLVVGMSELTIIGIVSAPYAPEVNYQCDCIDICVQGDTLHLIMAAAECDMYSYIYDSTIPRTLDPVLTCYRMALCLNQLHRQNIMHGDIKPENFLVYKDSTIKLCDYNLAETDTPTNYLVRGGKSSPVYQPPELQLLSMYDLRSDIWSLGLAFAELFTNEEKGHVIPLMVREDQGDIMLDIVETFGPVDVRTWPEGAASPRCKPAYIDAPIRHGIQYIAQTHPQLCELIRDMLEYNPQRRPTILEVLQHRVFSKIAGSIDIMPTRTVIPATLWQHGTVALQDYMHHRNRVFTLFATILGKRRYVLGRSMALFDTYISLVTWKVACHTPRNLIAGAILYIVAASVYCEGAVLPFTLESMIEHLQFEFTIMQLRECIAKVLQTLDYRLHFDNLFTLIGQLSRQRMLIALVLYFTEAPMHCSPQQLYAMVCAVLTARTDPSNSYLTAVRMYRADLRDVFKREKLLKLTDAAQEFYEPVIGTL